MFSVADLDDFIKKFDTVVLVPIGIHTVLQSDVRLMLNNFSSAF